MCLDPLDPRSMCTEPYRTLWLWSERLTGIRGVYSRDIARYSAMHRTQQTRSQSLNHVQGRQKLITLDSTVKQSANEAYLWRPIAWSIGLQRKIQSMNHIQGNETLSIIIIMAQKMKKVRQYLSDNTKRTRIFSENTRANIFSDDDNASFSSNRQVIH